MITAEKIFKYCGLPGSCQCILNKLRPELESKVKFEVHKFSCFISL